MCNLESIYALIVLESMESVRPTEAAGTKQGAYRRGSIAAAFKKVGSLQTLPLSSLRNLPKLPRFLRKGGVRQAT